MESCGLGKDTYDSSLVGLPYLILELFLKNIVEIFVLWLEERLDKEITFYYRGRFSGWF